MQAMPIRIFLVLFILVLIYPSSLIAATERWTALVIGNGSYDVGPLKNPVNDATDMAHVLTNLGFSVTLKQNVEKRALEDSIKEFGRKLNAGGVFLFYYAGHGVQVEGRNYLIPVGARIDDANDVKYEAVSLLRVLEAIEGAKTTVNIVILDACRDNPYARSFRSASRGLAIIPTTPSGTIISYATAAGQVSRDGEERNSPYTAALIKHIQEPGLTLEQVFKRVRNTLDKMTGGKQVPVEYTNLKADFYFKYGGGDTNDTPAITERDSSTVVISKLSPPALSETARDARFIAYDNGTVLDTSTNLMWAAKDNGEDINWADATSYCENYRGGGYSDWRMPTPDELAQLSDIKFKNTTLYRILTNLINLTGCCPWSSETRGFFSESRVFNFYHSERYWNNRTYNYDNRALPVRSGK